MSKKEVVIENLSKKYDNPIAELVHVACQFSSKIGITNGDKHYNAKSIMGMMTLGLDAGEEIVVSANGEDEENAMESIEKYLSNV